MHKISDNEEKNNYSQNISNSKNNNNRKRTYSFINKYKDKDKIIDNKKNNIKKYNLKIDNYNSKLNLCYSNGNIRKNKKINKFYEVIKFNKLKKVTSNHLNLSNSTLSTYHKRKNIYLINKSNKKINNNKTLFKNKSMNNISPSRNDINYLIVNYLNNNINNYSNDNNKNEAKNNNLNLNKNNINDIKLKTRKLSNYNSINKFFESNKINSNNNIKTISCLLNNNKINNNSNTKMKNNTITNNINNQKIKKNKKIHHKLIEYKKNINKIINSISKSKLNTNIINDKENNIKNFITIKNSFTNCNINNNHYINSQMIDFNSKNSNRCNNFKENNIKENEAINTLAHNKKMQYQNIYNNCLKNNKNQIIKIGNYQNKKMKHFMKLNIKDYFGIKIKNFEKNKVNNITNSKKRYYSHIKTRSISLNSDSAS